MTTSDTPMQNPKTDEEAMREYAIRIVEFERELSSANDFAKQLADRLQEAERKVLEERAANTSARLCLDAERRGNGTLARERDAALAAAVAVQEECAKVCGAQALDHASGPARLALMRATNTIRALNIDALKAGRELLEPLRRDAERLDWLDLHCSFVADGEYKIGPYLVGQLRQMADDGLAQDAAIAAGEKS